MTKRTKGDATTKFCELPGFGGCTKGGSVIGSTPGLLISVRSAEEAIAALDGGADWIDIKEPRRGPLGAASWDTIDQVVHRVAGRAPISIAAGELLDLADDSCLSQSTKRGVWFVKVGLGGCAEVDDWRLRWRAAQLRAATAGLVAVVYADWQQAAAPEPDAVLRLAQQYRSPALLVDTFDKSGGNLLDRWPLPALGNFVARVRRSGIAPVLAGSLDQGCVAQVVALRPAIIGIRGAACDGDRGGRISPVRVAELRTLVDQPHSKYPRPMQSFG